MNTAGRSGRLVPLAALVFGVVLFALATPRAMSGLILAAQRAPLAALGRGEAPPPPVLAEAAAARRAALRWFDDATLHTDLAALEIARASAPGMPGDLRRAYLDAAIAEYRIGLAAGPSRPFAWAQYAEAAFARDGAEARLAPLIAMSIATGPRDPRLAARRIELGFRTDRQLDAATRQAIREQVRVVAAGSPERLTLFARQRYALGWVRAALAEDEALRRRFEADYFNRTFR